MAARLTEDERERIRKDFSAGMSVEAIRKKHQTSWPTAKAIVADITPPKKANGVAAPYPPPARNLPPAVATGTEIGKALFGLRSLRERLDRAISVLEEIGSA